ncbi:diacylglycerol kinase [Arachidicoccus ginsenosidimutans]|uniref:diacylglycerol/lipid kinase family protein n=1 Tax=Arachidicoccus sp. BS20 TaxID=1850526 RepID=UPI0007F07CE3|nr:YegS/Rv2252/BmrU family lipid kinase [Arachidicoccus sp. BS20]ANI89928.1 diacylglycerol kinase [Arachidicoccus sp. BS20]
MKNSPAVHKGTTKTARKIIYLVNPISGTSKKSILVSLIEKISEERGLYCEILYTNKDADYDFLSEKIAEENITDVVILGGDGTVNNIVGALHHLKINFGIIPFGSGNGLARAAGIPSKPKEALELIFAGKSKNVDAFSVNGKFACMLSGVGFDAKVAHDFSTKSTRGLLTYTQQSIINYFKAQPYQFEVEVDSFKFFTDAFFISIANGNQFGNNFTIAPKANLNDGLLDIVIVQKMNKAKLPFAVLKQIRGNNKLEELVEEITQKNVLYFQTPEIKIKNLKNAPMHIDGEPVNSENELNIKAVKSCFKLIMP